MLVAVSIIQFFYIFESRLWGRTKFAKHRVNSSQIIFSVGYWNCVVLETNQNKSKEKICNISNRIFRIKQVYANAQSLRDRKDELMK